MSKYVLITPVRDEESHIAGMIDSVLRQTILPAKWIIVNDGSSDETGSIINEYARQYPWIVALHREDRGRRAAGSGVMEAFYAGYEQLQCKDWDFIGKFDGDLILEESYFESCFQRFAEDPRLGICGGLLYCEENGELRPDRQPPGHVRGAVKLYRWSCWSEIGGLIRSTGWDTADEIHANMLGWRTATFDAIRVIHCRPTGAAAGAWSDSAKNGHADYVSGYHPLFLIAKCLRLVFRKPYILRSLGHAYGYFGNLMRGAPRCGNAALVRYIRMQQLRRLFLLPSHRQP